MMKRILACVVLLVFLVSAPSYAVKLPGIIGSNMVIQQNTDVPVWGWSKPNAEVTIQASWLDEKKTAFSDSSGKWFVRIQSPSAGGPFTMVVSDEESAIHLTNILAGEVWLASGQSNMAFRLRRADNGATEIPAANFPQIRFFAVGRARSDVPLDDCKGEWQICTPESASEMSAVAYFFVKELHQRLGVPIALVGSDYGGTYAETWTSEEVLRSDPDYAPIFEQWAEWERVYEQDKAEYEERMKEWEVLAGGGADSQNPNVLPKPEMPQSVYQISRPYRRPAILFNGMVSPVIPFAIQGVIWYQGEQNSRRGYQYRKLFPAMIQDWRTRWGQGDFPFYFVQIAPFAYSTGSAAELREAQFLTMQNIANTGMAVILDVGERKNIHPTNKIAVGHRLALWALAKTYGFDDIVYSGPIYRSMQIEGGRIRLFFDSIGTGLAAKGGTLEDFIIAGEDRNFVSAQARIDGDTIVVWSDSIENPVAVRYGWSNYCEGSLRNKEGLPASSFRTDDWQGLSFGKNSEL